MRDVMKGLAPPVVVDVARRRRRPTPIGRERDASFYEERFETRGTWKTHYTASRYYFLWTVIADRLLQGGHRSVLDIGCGAGQLAHLLSDRGVEEYRGVDFAEKRVAWARELVPQYRFDVADAFTFDYDDIPYTAVISTEFLEHVERDLDLFPRLRAGARFIGTVPNFGAAGHVRKFDTAEEVVDRYGAVLEELRVDPMLSNDRGTTFYLLDGTVR